MKHTLGYSVLTGLGIGFPVTLLCMTLIGGFNEIVAEFLIWMVASALFGLLSGLIFYTKNDLNLPVSMGLHCTGCLMVAVTAAWLCGYADSFGALLTGILPVFVIVYGLIFAGCYFAMKRNEKQINQALDQE